MKEQARILVVDDNEAGRYALARCLRQAGHEVLEAGTARQFLGYIGNSPCDLILLDVKLPDIDGTEVCKQLKADPRTARIPVIQISALLTAPADRVEGLESGADAYLAMPFEPRELLAHVDQLLRTHRAEERLRQMVELNPQIPWTATSDGVVEDLSERWLSLTGMTREESVGTGWLNAVHPEDVLVVQAAWSRAMKTAKPYDVEHRIRTVGGKHRWVHSRAYPHFGSDGRVLRWYGFTEDIQERVEAQRALRASEAKYRTLFNAMDEGFFLIDVIFDANDQPVDLYYVEANAAAIRMLGQDYTGKRLSEIDPGYEKYWFEIFGKVALTGESVRMERYAAPDKRWYSFSAFKVGDATSRRIGNTFQDITARKREQEALRRSEERLRQAAGLVGLCSYTWNPQTGQLDWDPGIKPMWGLPPDAVIDFPVWRSRVHPDDLPVVEQRVAHSLDPAGDGLYEAEYRVNGADGVQRWVSSRGRTTFSRGKPVLHLGVVVEITGRKQIEEALRESEERFRSLADGTPVLIWVHDSEGGLRFVNHAWREFFGVTLEQVRGGNWQPLVRPEDAPGYVDVFLNCHAQRKEFHAQARVRRHDGEWRWVESFGVPRFSTTGQYLGIAGSSVDVTERKRAEDLLHQAVERYEQQVRLFEGVASTTPDFVYVFDLEGRFLYANRRLLEVWGMKLEEVVGKTCRELGYEQWHHDMHMREIAQVIATRQPIKGEVPFKAPRTGIFGIYEYIFTPVIGPGGTVEVIAGTTRDVTERKRAEEVLARDKVELESLVAERTAKLQELVAELEHFSYTITHDMRAPLRAMRGIAEIMMEVDAEWSQEERRKFTRRIITAAERMDGLITDALHYSKLMRQDLPLAPVDPRRLLTGMLDTYPEFQSVNAKIEIDENLPRVMANEAGLTQCFSNLLDNAVKFVKPGQKPEVRIWAELVHSKPREGQTGNADWVRIWVEDNGPGISETMLSRVFHMFARGSSAQAGTGIGLALVRKVVDRMGGRVGVESEVGKGSRFWVELKPGEPRPVDAGVLTGEGR